WECDGWRAPKHLAIARPLWRYLWESPLDASLPDGARAFLPSRWLTVGLNLAPSPADITCYLDSSGNRQFIGSREGKDGSSALIRSELFNSYLKRQQLCCIWLLVAERGSWPGGHNKNAAWRRTEGICWLEDGKPMATTWNEDRVNGR